MRLLDPLKIELEKNILIEASAGTGKTYTITTLFTRLVARGFSVDSILVVTFTESAAAELKDRIRRRLAFVLSSLDKQDIQDNHITDELVLYFRKNANENTEEVISRIRQAIVCFDEAAIMTIHSFCFKILKENAFETGVLFNVKLLPDANSVLRDIVLDFVAIEINNLDPFFLRFLKNRNFRIQSLVSLLKRFIPRPYIEIIPDPEQVKFCDVSQDYLDTCKKLLEIIKNKKEEIKEIIFNHKGLNKRSYTKRFVKKWLDDAENSLLESRIFDMTEKGDSLYKFTCSRLKEKNKQGYPAPSHIFFDLCEKLMELTDLLEKNIIAIKIRFFSFVMKELDIRKESLGICFFDDIVNGLSDALEGQSAEMLVKGIRKKYSAVLIDEFQDTDQRQYSIFSKIFSGTKAPFLMIGDPKQAIYAFRGGDIFAYLRAVKDTSDRAYTLEVNWRSAPLLVSAVNLIFASLDNPFYFKEIKFNPVTTPLTAKNTFMKNNSSCPPFQFFLISGEIGNRDKKGLIKKEWADKNIPMIIADDIASLLTSNASIIIKEGMERDISPGDIAVLVRTNTQAEAMNNALSCAGIPSYISKTGSVFDSKEADEIADLLAAVLDPDNSGFMGAALCSDLFAVSDMDIFLMNSDDSLYHQWHLMFRNWKSLWENNGIIRMLQDIFHSEYAMYGREGAGNNELSERSLTNYFHLAELLHKAEREKYLSPFSLFKWFLNQRIPDMREQYSDELRLETDEESVSIITIHKSKGMEYPIVYLPFLWDGVIHAERNDNPVFHDPDDGNREKIDLGSNDIKKSKQKAVFEEQAESMRLLYVGLTRASSMCRIVWGSFKSVEKSALFKLIHNGIPEFGKASDKDQFPLENSMIEDINYLKKESNGSISVDFYKGMKNKQWHKDHIKEDEELICGKMPFEIVQEWRFASFSMISSLQGENEGQGDDQYAIDDFKGLLRSDKLLYSDKTNDYSMKISLADFPKGSAAGTLIHSVFEHIDFQAEGDSIREIIAEELVKYGFDSSKWLPDLIKAFSEILATPIYNYKKNQQGHEKQDYFSLRDINKDRRLNEMDFVFPFRSFSKDLIADIFRKHMKKSIGPSYADRFMELEFDTIKGFMNGFIDLVFEFNGKWYIIDYKSNYLGDAYFDYSEANLISAMIEHHYFLQYYIYVIALHRYLGLRLNNYDYRAHFGGVLYLFIRGMHPDLGHGAGVFYDKPDYIMIEKLSDLF